MPITTPARVRQRLSIEVYQAPDTMINDFIIAAEGEIRYRLGRLPVLGDDDYDFASAVATGIAALSTGTQIPYPESQNESEAWIAKLKMIRGKASSDMTNLSNDPYPNVPLPRSTTVES